MNVGQCVSPALRSPCGHRAGETPCPTFMVPLQVAVNVEALHERRAVRLAGPSKSLWAPGRRDALPYVHGPIAGGGQRGGSP